jgi:tRNA-guanine family transglycosylase
MFLGYCFDYRSYFIANVLPQCTGIMVNTYYVKLRYHNMFNICKKLGFNGVVFTDSGGFQLSTKSVFGRNKPAKSYEQNDVLRDQIDLGSDFAATLDFPLDPKGDSKSNMKRIRKSLANVEKAVKFVQDKETSTVLVPVVHGYNRQMIVYGLKNLEKLEDELSYCFPVLAIGSLVPLYADRSNAGSERLLDAFHTVHELVSKDRVIHVMGAGSPLSMRFYYWLGAKSLDTRSWLTNAVFGKLVMPGDGRISVTDLIQRFGSRARICNCPACKDCELKDLAQSRMRRAIHNALIYLQEFRRIEREIKNGVFEETTRRLMKDRIYFRRILDHGSYCD